MIVDTSAIVAILRGEPEEASFIAAIQASTRVRISAGTYVEAGIVLDGVRRGAADRVLDTFIEMAGIAIEPVTEEHARIARRAYRDFGRGSGHPARLNFGDCFAYALAKAAGEPLLFKGNDFSQTDIMPAAGA